MINLNLNFSSRLADTKYPVAKKTVKKVQEGNKMVSTTAVFGKTRETIAIVDVLNEKGILAKRVRTSVLCHPREQDCKVVGQKYALEKVIEKYFGEDSEAQTQLWGLFKTRSKAATNLMAPPVKA